MNNNELDDLLRSTAQDPPLPTSFRSEVWTRIASAEQRSLTAWCHRFLEFMVHPLPAAASVVATVVIGISLGLASAPTAKDARLSYAESISPFLHQNAP